MKVQPSPTPNRSARRAALRALPKVSDELHGLAEVDLTEIRSPKPARAWTGTQISVQQYDANSIGTTFNVLCRLSIRRHDGERLREHWRTMYRIKELLFPGHCAFEIYPRAEKLVDDAPMWHLWVLKLGEDTGVVLL